MSNEENDTIRNNQNEESIVNNEELNIDLNNIEHIEDNIADRNHLNNAFDSATTSSDDESDILRGIENINENDENNAVETDDERDDELNLETIDTEQEDEADDYDKIQKPCNLDSIESIPSSHNYLGQNFHDITTPKLIHNVNDHVLIPLLYLPGNSITSFDDENNVQLLPGQMLPIYFYSPLQIQVIKKRYLFF